MTVVARTDGVLFGVWGQQQDSRAGHMLVRTPSSHPNSCCVLPALLAFFSVRQEPVEFSKIGTCSVLRLPPLHAAAAAAALEIVLLTHSSAQLLLLTTQRQTATAPAPARQP